MLVLRPLRLSSAPFVGMTSYVGRFAPTPSGPLHLGSLLTALGSFLAARAAGGRWLLRIDDLDTPRVQPGAERRILRQLEAHGLHWDERPRRQSEHLDEYADALDRLRQDGLLYACVCTRAQLQQQAAPGWEEPVYSGHCRNLHLAETNAALRVRVEGGTEQIEDRIRGTLSGEIDRDIGDFVLRRKDGQFAYQLACAVDEAAQSITDVVRGADLIPSTFKQAWLMRRLGVAVPRYAHLPLLADAGGLKLSKQNGATEIRTDQATRNMREALRLLGQALPSPSPTEDVAEILSWAIRHWSPARVPRGPLKIA